MEIKFYSREISEDTDWRDIPPEFRLDILQNFTAKCKEISDHLGSNDDNAILNQLSIETNIDKRTLKSFQDKKSTNKTGYKKLFSAFKYVNALETDANGLFDAVKDHRNPDLNLTYGIVGEEKDFNFHLDNITKGMSFIKNLWEKRDAVHKAKGPMNVLEEEKKLSKFINKEFPNISLDKFETRILLQRVPRYLQPPEEKGKSKKENFAGYLVIVTSAAIEDKEELPSSKAIDIDWRNTFES